MKAPFLAALLAALALCLTATVSVASAGGSTINGTGHCNPGDPACGANPVLTGPIPPFVTVQGNCPDFLYSDSWAVNWVDGNSVSHGTENKNGGWGGFTAEGPAVLTSSDGTAQYSGHATVWGGGGNNKAGQSENGFTLTFNASGPAGTISIQAHSHQTTNNAGTLTSNVLSATVTCS